MGIMEDVNMLPQVRSPLWLWPALCALSPWLSVRLSFPVLFLAVSSPLKPTEGKPGFVDLTVNVVERKTGGFSAGGGLSARWAEGG